MESCVDFMDIWEEPPKEYRPLQIIHQYTPDTEEEIIKYLQEADTRGLGGFVVNVDVGPTDPEQFSKYLVDEGEWSRLKLFISLALTYGFTVWLYDERGYPSGSAGKWVIDGNPEFQVKGIICQRCCGTTGELELEDGELISIAAYRCTSEGLSVTDVVCLNDKVHGKHVQWDLPDGEWVVAAFVCKDLNWIAKAGTPYVDILNPEVVKKFIKVTHESYASRLGPNIMEQIKAIFTDEPGIPVHGCATIFREKSPVVPWTPGLDKRFLDCYGYSLFENLPKLFFDTRESYQKVRKDYWLLVSMLLEESYFRQIGDWCERRNIKFTGHLYGEETLSMQVGLEGELFGVLRHMQMPGVDRLYCTNLQDVIPEKTASSVAHLLGREQVMSESSNHFEQAYWKRTVDVADMINAGTYQFVLGINIIASYFSFNLVSSEDRSLYQRYMGRLSGFLTNARHIAPILVHIPMVDIWKHYEPQDKKYWLVGPGYVAPGQPEPVRKLEERFGRLPSYLMDTQWDFDLIDDRGLAQCSINYNGNISTGFEEFQVLITLDSGDIEPELDRQLERFVAQKGLVIVLQEDQSRISSAYTDKPGIVIVKDIDELADILDASISKDFKLREPAPYIWYLHKTRGNSDIYLVYNKDSNDRRIEVELAAKGHIRVFYPLNGRIEEWGRSQPVCLEIPGGTGVLVVVQRCCEEKVM